MSSEKWKLGTVSLLRGFGSYHIQVGTKEDRLEFMDRQQKDWTKVVQMTSSHPSMRIGGSYLTADVIPPVVSTVFLSRSYQGVSRS